MRYRYDFYNTRMINTVVQQIWKAAQREAATPNGSFATNLWMPFDKVKHTVDLSNKVRSDVWVLGRIEL